MLKSLSWAAAIAAVLTVSTRVEAGFVPLANAGFESPTIGAPYETFPPSPLPGWTVDAGTNVDLVKAGSGYGPAYEGNQFLDLNGTGDGPISAQGSISQTLDLVAGVTYTLQFAMRNNPGTTVPISVLASISGEFTDLAFNYTSTYNGNWALMKHTFVAGASGTATLKFTSTTGGNSGVFLDAVAVTVPEPTSMAIAGLGVAGLVGARMRRRKAAAKGN